MARTFIFASILQLLFCVDIFAKSWDEFSQGEKQNVLLTTAYETGQRRKFRPDCSGYIEAVLTGVGHEYFEFLQMYGIRGNGVAQIYEFLARSGTIYKDKNPQTGDIIFFSRTYDINRDRRYDDPLTHIGIIENVDRDGTIVFLHVLHRKLQTDFMNLNKPNIHEENGKIINSYLRRAHRGSEDPVLTAQLFESFGTLH